MKNIKRIAGNVLAAAAFFATANIMTGCSADFVDTEDINPKQLSFIVQVNEGNTRAQTNGMSTTFEVGDKAGLFAVKDGKVLDAFHNVQLTYSQTGSWQLPTAVMYSSEYEGVQFYAYYPYDEEMTFDGGKADPFEEYVSTFTPTVKQGTQSGYEQADLMTSNGTMIGELNTVRIKMRHRMAMVAIELPNQSYIFTNEGMEPYVMKSARQCQFAVDGEAVTPYFDKASQTYRIITRPNTVSKLTLAYVDGSEEKHETLDISHLQSGQAHTEKVDGGVCLTTFTLQIGDYFCNDGTLLSRDETLSEEEAAKVIGVVYRIGTAACLQEDYPSATHAEVLALNVASSIAKDVTAQWGGIKDPGTMWKGWYTTYGLNALGSSIKDVAETTLTDIGYQQTMIWLEAENPFAFNGETKDIHGEFLATYNTFTACVPAPSKTCGWYVPSLRDFIYVYQSKDIIDSSLNTAKGDAIDIIGSKYYWTCQLSTESTMWACNGMTVSNFSRQNFYNKQCHRFVTAF